MKIIEEPEENPLVSTLGDIAETIPTDILIDQDEEADEEIQILLAEK